MALRLSENWRDELSRTRLAGRFSAPQLAELWPSYPADAPVTIAEASRLIDPSVATPLPNQLPPRLQPTCPPTAQPHYGSTPDPGPPRHTSDPPAPPERTTGRRADR